MRYKMRELEARIVLDAEIAEEAQTIASINEGNNLLPDIIDVEEALGDIFSSPNIQEEINLLIISSSIENQASEYEEINELKERAEASGTLVLVYDFNSTLNELQSSINQVLNGSKAHSIALAGHANSNTFELVHNTSVDLESINNEEITAFFTHIHEQLTEDGRLDLLGCNITEENDALVSALEELSGITIAASSNVTGAEHLGGDWHLERGAIDVEEVYFDNQELNQWEGTLAESSLFFSEYAEGSANNKYLEIYNPTDAEISLDGYAYPSVANAPGVVGQYEFWNPFDEGAVIAAGDVYIVAHPIADEAILAEADEIYGYLSNGDDGFALVKGTEEDYEIIDWIGDFQGDPGSGWDVAGVSAATKDHTLVRKSSVTSGNTDWTVSAGTNTDDSEWIVLEQNDWSNLRQHSVDSYSLFFSEYAEGSANNKYLEIYNPTDAEISLEGYALAYTLNGGLSTHEFWIDFPEDASIAAKAVYVIAHSNASKTITDQTDWLVSALSNGDDGFALVEGNEDSYTVIDTIGTFGDDPGAGWDVAGVSDATKNHTLIRKPLVTSGNDDWLTSAGTNADDSEWIVLDQDNFTNLGIASDSEITAEDYAPFFFNSHALFKPSLFLGSEEAMVDKLAISAELQKAVVTNIDQGQLYIFDLSQGLVPGIENTITLDGRPSAVQTLGNNVLVVLDKSTEESTAGALVVYSLETNELLSTFDLESIPDAITISPDLSKVVVSLENQGGFPIGRLAIFETAEDLADWTPTTLSLQEMGAVFETAIEAKELAISPDGKALAVSLQENNAIALVDLTTNTLSRVIDLGEVTLNDIDATEEELPFVSLSETITVSRKADRICWIDNSTFATANEGSRGFSIFNIDGTLQYDSANQLDHLVASYGAYPEYRSENNGIEPENIQYAEINDIPVILLTAERANMVFVFDVIDVTNPQLVDVLFTSKSPSDLKVFSTNDETYLLVTSDAQDLNRGIRSSIELFKLEDYKAQPALVSDPLDRNDATKPWAALSGLTNGPSNSLWAVNDNDFGPSTIYQINVEGDTPTIVDQIAIVDSNDILKGSQLEMIDSSGSVILDLEGIAYDSENNTFWVVSEGDGNYGDENILLNTLIQVDTETGTILQVKTLPESLNVLQKEYGFSGIEIIGENIYVAIQRAWTEYPDPFIAVFDKSTGDYSHKFFYPLESPIGDEILSIGDLSTDGKGNLLVLEIDNQSDNEAVTKKVFKVAIDAIEEDQTVEKTLGIDLVDTVLEDSTRVFKKIDGLAYTDDRVYLGNDNDANGKNSPFGKTAILSFASDLLLESTDDEVLVLKAILDLDLAGDTGKAVIIQANTNITDLSAYSLSIYPNGSSTAQTAFFPSMQLNIEDTLIIARSPDSIEAFLDVALPEKYKFVQASGSLSFNGDDVITLNSPSGTLETFGQIGVDLTDTALEYTDSFQVKLDDWITPGVRASTDLTNLWDLDGAATYFPLFNGLPRLEGELETTLAEQVLVDNPPLSLSAVFDLELDGNTYKAVIIEVLEAGNLGDYQIATAFNGNPIFSQFIDLPDTYVEQGDRILFTNEDFAIRDILDVDRFFSHVLTPDSNLQFNGNDVVAITEKASSSPIEIFGELGIDGENRVWNHRGTFAFKQEGKWGVLPKEELIDLSTLTDLPADRQFLVELQNSRTQAVEIVGVLDLALEGTSGKAIHLQALEDITDLSSFGWTVQNNYEPLSAIEGFFPALSVLAGDDILIAKEPNALERYMNASLYYDHIFTANDFLDHNGDDSVYVFRNGFIEDSFDASNGYYGDTWAYKVDDEWVVGTPGSFAEDIWTSSSPYPFVEYKLENASVELVNASLESSSSESTTLGINTRYNTSNSYYFSPGSSIEATIDLSGAYPLYNAAFYMVSPSSVNGYYADAQTTPSVFELDFMETNGNLILQATSHASGDSAGAWAYTLLDSRAAGYSSVPTNPSGLEIYNGEYGTFNAAYINRDYVDLPEKGFDSSQPFNLRIDFSESEDNQDGYMSFSVTILQDTDGNGAYDIEEKVFAPDTVYSESASEPTWAEGANYQEGYTQSFPIKGMNEFGWVLVASHWTGFEPPAGDIYNLYMKNYYKTDSLPYWNDTSWTISDLKITAEATDYTWSDSAGTGTLDDMLNNFAVTEYSSYLSIEKNDEAGLSILEIQRLDDGQWQSELTFSSTGEINFISNKYSPSDPIRLLLSETVGSGSDAYLSVRSTKPYTLSDFTAALSNKAAENFNAAEAILPSNNLPISLPVTTYQTATPTPPDSYSSVASALADASSTPLSTVKNHATGGGDPTKVQILHKYSITSSKSLTDKLNKVSTSDQKVESESTAEGSEPTVEGREPTVEESEPTTVENESKDGS